MKRQRNPRHRAAAAGDLVVRRPKHHCERGSKMKSLFLTTIVAGACIASAGNTCRGAEKDELQGEWVATSIEVNGKRAALEGTRLEFKGDAVVLRHEDNKGMPDEGTYKTDSKKSPKHLDITIKKKTLHGIYEVKGEELKVCFETGEKPENRPTKFATNPEKEESLLVLKRKKP